MFILFKRFPVAIDGSNIRISDTIFRWIASVNLIRNENLLFLWLDFDWYFKEEIFTWCSVLQLLQQRFWLAVKTIWFGIGAILVVVYKHHLSKTELILIPILAVNFQLLTSIKDAIKTHNLIDERTVHWTILFLRSKQ